MTELHHPRQKIACYKLLKVVGRGGMGVVYQARDLKLDRTIALKTVRTDRPPSAREVERFNLEAKLVAKLNHPFIVSIHDVGFHEGIPFFTMEYVEGQSLSEFIREDKSGLNTRIQILRDCCNAISHAHQHGIVHRDLKPSNVLIDAEFNPRIVDFGLAKLLNDDQHLTMTGQAVGTPYYMPPEQALGLLDEIGPHSDVYGLGGILYTLLTGNPPIEYDPRNAKNILQRIIDELPKSPSSINSLIDRDLEAICLKCLEKRPSDRYANATELAIDLQRYIDGESISARRNSYGRIVRHWMQKPERISQSATMVLVIAAFFGVTTLVGGSILTFEPIELTSRPQFAMIVLLDTLGLISCSLLTFGLFARKSWSGWLGMSIGLTISVIVATLILTGHPAGGILDDPFFRISAYTIFGFIGIVLFAISFVAYRAINVLNDAIYPSETRPQSTDYTTLPE